MSRMPCNIEDGPEYEEPVYDREEPDPDDLNDTLRDIARLSEQTDRLDNLYTGLCEGMYRKNQA